MTTPNLPVRYDIENDGTGAAESFEHICSTVISEGGLQPNGIVRSVDRGSTAFVTLNNTSNYPILSMRLKDNREQITVLPTYLSIMNIGNPNYRWALVYNPSIVGVDNVSWTALANSSIEFDIARTNAGTASGGIQVASGYVSNSIDSDNVDIENALRLGVSLLGVKDELVLVVQNLTAGIGNFYGSLNFRELL